MLLLMLRDLVSMVGFQTQVIQQTGKTMVNYDGEKFTNNINDPDIEKSRRSALSGR